MIVNGYFVKSIGGGVAVWLGREGNLADAARIFASTAEAVAWSAR